MESLFTVLGYFFGLVLSVKFGLWLLTWLAVSMGRKFGMGVKWRSDRGEFAVITGATGSTGSEYAREFASMGFNLVLISRNHDKVEKLAQSLKEKYHLRMVRTIQSDFNRPECFNLIREELSDIFPIVALVNAMACSLPPKPFLEHPPNFNHDVLWITVIGTVLMCEIVLPRMVELERGVIINVSSQAGDFHFPFYTTFSAAKSFVNTISDLLAIEYKNKGIVVQSARPLFVHSSMAAELKPNFLFLSPARTVWASMQAVGIETATYGHWKHRISALALDILIFLVGQRLTSTICGNYLMKRFVKVPEGEGLTTIGSNSIDEEKSASLSERSKARTSKTEDHETSSTIISTTSSTPSLLPPPKKDIRIDIERFKSETEPFQFEIKTNLAKTFKFDVKPEKSKSKSKSKSQASKIRSSKIASQDNSAMASLESSKAAKSEEDAHDSLSSSKSRFPKATSDGGALLEPVAHTEAKSGGVPLPGPKSHTETTGGGVPLPGPKSHIETTGGGVPLPGPKSHTETTGGGVSLPGPKSHTETTGSGVSLPGPKNQTETSGGGVSLPGPKNHIETTVGGVPLPGPKNYIETTGGGVPLPGPKSHTETTNGGVSLPEPKNHIETTIGGISLPGPKPLTETTGRSVPLPGPKSHIETTGGGVPLPGPKPITETMGGGVPLPGPKSHIETTGGGVSLPGPKSHIETTGGGVPLPGPKSHIETTGGGVPLPGPKSHIETTSGGVPLPGPKPTQNMPKIDKNDSSEWQTPNKPSELPIGNSGGVALPKSNFPGGVALPKPNANEGKSMGGFALPVPKPDSSSGSVPEPKSQSIGQTGGFALPKPRADQAEHKAVGFSLPMPPKKSEP